MKNKYKAFRTAFLSLTIATTSGGFAGTISWQEPVDLFQGDANDETFVSTNGIEILAYNATSIAEGGVDATVNGVTFFASEVGTVLGGPTGETITINNGRNNQGAFAASQFAGANPAVTLISGGSFDIQNVTLGGLSVGTVYEIQVIVHDGRDSRANSVTAYSAEEGGAAVSSPANLNNSNTGAATAGNTGDYTLGTFTADAATQTFEVFGDGNTTGGITFATGISFSAINAIQLRDISTIAGDSDGDGMTDIYEIANNINPNDDGSIDPINGANGDFDEDGITNIDEFNAVPQLLAGTADVDEDGLNDGQEVDGLVNTLGDPVAMADQLTNGTSLGAATNPFVADTDGDGLDDGDEVNGTTNGSLNPTFPELVTDPNSADSDSDQLTDDFEVLNQLDARDNGGTDVNNGNAGDPDGDSLDNFLEQNARTNPQNPDTDEDGLPDGGIVDANGNETGELIVGTGADGFPNIASTFADPLDPDSDNDGILDGEEAFPGEDGSITNPELSDTDGDGIPDSFEILVNVDPADVAAVPDYADITWSVAAVTDYVNVAEDGIETNVTGEGLNALRNDGTLLYAENYAGPDVEANRVPFTGITTGSFPQFLPEAFPISTDNFFTVFSQSATAGTVFGGPTTELNDLLDSVLFTGQPTVLLSGLTPGTQYFVQFGISEDRNGRDREGRFITVDGFGGDTSTELIGPDNTIFGGSANPALIFTGTFTANLPTQAFVMEVFNEGSETPGAQVLYGFTQVRIDDGTTLPPLGTDVEIVDCGFDENGDFFIELANDATGAIVSASPDLVADFTPIAGVSVTVVGNTITIAGAALDPTRSFLRVSF